MKKRPRCLHAASRRFVSSRGVTRELHYMCKSDACTKFQRWRALTRTQGGAFGVVGFSGVKDARESVIAADAKRRLAHRRLGQHARASTGQTLDKDWTGTGRTLDKNGAHRGAMPRWVL